ncbi:MAG: Crp/Fnr family transcriptional regulator [Sphingomonadales bacterium]
MAEQGFEDLPALQQWGAEAAAQFRQAALPVALPAGAKAFEAGGPCGHYLVIAEGRIRVQQLSPSGREIVLYRVSGGETCILTTACLLAHEHYAAEAVAETDVRGYALPRASFDRLLAQSQPFRDYVFSAYASRLTDLMLLVEEIAFGHVDIRLAQKLLARADADANVAATHQDMAIELGTAREVISRQLKEFERRGWVELARGRIVLRDKAALAALVENGRTW